MKQKYHVDLDKKRFKNSQYIKKAVFKHLKEQPSSKVFTKSVSDLLDGMKSFGTERGVDFFLTQVIFISLI